MKEEVKKCILAKSVDDKFVRPIGALDYRGVGP
jgi:hypothetical protein